MTYVTTSEVKLKSGTGLFCATKARIPEGAVLKSSHKVEGWAYIDRYKAWAPMATLRRIDE